MTPEQRLRRAQVLSVTGASLTLIGLGLASAGTAGIVASGGAGYIGADAQAVLLAGFKAPFIASGGVLWWVGNQRKRNARE